MNQEHRKKPNTVKTSLKAIARALINSKLGRAVVTRAAWMLNDNAHDRSGRVTQPGPAGPVALSPPESMGKFIDSNGISHVLIDGYRDKAVPRWRGMFEPKRDIPTVEVSSIMAARNAVSALGRDLEVHGYGLGGRDVLEVGCHGGAHALALVQAGAARVDAIDIPEYGVRQKSVAAVSEAELMRQSGWLDRLRMATWQQFQQVSGCSSTVCDGVSFAQLNVTDLDAADRYDLIVSWQTLEHVAPPERAIARMARALRPGGVMYHEYNPFFCAAGGHSLCTLDIPWGHVRLSDADVERYLREYRPAEAEAALRFYRDSLNRMTLADLRKYLAQSGLDILELIAWPQPRDVESVSPTLFAQCRTHYPSVTIGDLISSRVVVVASKV